MTPETQILTKPAAAGESIPFVSAVVAAAGASSRMEGANKIFAPLLGVPVLARTLLALQNCPVIREIVAVVREEHVADVQKLAAAYEITKLRAVEIGGKDRGASVAAGVRACSEKTELFAVHDGARPLVNRRVIEEAVKKAAETGAAAPAVPVKDTVKIADGGFVVSTPKRETLFAVQTPQVFEAEQYIRCLERARLQNLVFTDDCGLFEACGLPVALTAGDYRNIKITTPEDLILAEAFLLCGEGGRV